MQFVDGKFASCWLSLEFKPILNVSFLLPRSGAPCTLRVNQLKSEAFRVGLTSSEILVPPDSSSVPGVKEHQGLDIVQGFPLHSESTIPRVDYRKTDYFLGVF
jgi:hypothetical protein